MKRVLFRGSGVAIATPFTEDGLDAVRLRERVLWQIDEGTDAIIVCGTTGEPSTMPLEERDRAVGIALEASAGRVPVIVGAGSNSTVTAIKLSQRAERLGADGLLVVTPYYNRPNQRGLIEHYRAIADNTGIPIILYNVPSRTGVNLMPGTVAELAAHPRIVALKEANGDLVRLMETISLVGDDFAIYSGNDDQILPIMALGGLGVISVAANLVPAQVCELAKACFDGDMERARAIQLWLLPLIKLLFREPNPQPLKAAMAILGTDTGILRPPLGEVGEETKQALRAELGRMKLYDDATFTSDE